MSIRKYSEGDFKSVEEIYNLSKLDELVEETAQFSLLPLSNDRERNKQLFESQVFVYELESVVAFGAIFKSEIRGLFVHPEYRGKGFGKALFKHLLSMSSHTVSLHVADSNSHAKAMYEKFGFVVTESFEMKYNLVPVKVNKMVKSQG